MAENYLITGYWGVPHVTSENDRGINAAIFGAGRFVLPVGEQFRAEYIGNNTVRIYDGKLIDNGAVAGIPAGEYVDLLIPEAGQGMKRNDLIVFQYSQDPSTLIESGVFMVLSGDETSGTATDPALSQEDLLTNEATLDQMALWRIPVSGTVISTPVQLFGVTKNMINAGASVVEATSSDGETYSATVPGITELYAGLEIIIIPQLESTSETITLDVNGLGAKNVRLPLSSNTTTLVMPENPNYYTAGRPVKLRYDAMWLNKGAWVVAERQRTSGNDMYGSVPVQNGGIVVNNDTTEEDKEEAIENLSKINPQMIVGKAYRTTERWNGKAVYATLLDFGALPNNSRKTVYANILESANFKIVGGVTALLSSGVFVNGVGYDSNEHASGAHIMITSAGGAIAINTDYNASGVTATVFYKFTID